MGDGRRHASLPAARMTSAADPRGDAGPADDAPALIAVDWGTTALRGALLVADGRELARHAAPRGLLGIAPGGWQAAFDAEFGAWRAAHPGLPCLMAGMVGSRQGWAEAPYAACPAGPADLAARLLWLQPGSLAIVPGLSTEVAGIPDVMRGEETQVFGALELLGLQRHDRVRLVLPGTHSKWVDVQRGRITGFASHMTGECYALFRRQSILARSLPDDDDGPWQPEAFDRGVALAQTPGGLLHHLFAVRTLSLFDRADAPALASLLSGLVIGEELRAQGAAELAADAQAGAPVVIVGAPALTARYERALATLSVPSATVGGEAGWRGLAALAGTLGR